VPLPGDYDGDGRIDLAVFRPANGMWYILKSSGNYNEHTDVQLGLSGDVPVPGDYDGDHHTDPAVFRPATAMWYIRRSKAAAAVPLEIRWGLPGDVPVGAR